MPIFKIVVSEPKTRKSYQLEVDQEKVPMLIGKKMGEDFDGNTIGLAGYTLEIRGGTDIDGFPMHPNLKGQGKKKLLLSSRPGFHPPQKGQRRRKMVRGNTVSSDIIQLNVKVVKAGTEPLEKLLPKKVKEGEVKKEEAKPEKKEETKKPEAKPEKKAEEKKEEVKKEEPKKEEKPKTEEKPKEQKPVEEKKAEEKPVEPEPEKKDAKPETTGGGEGKE